MSETKHSPEPWTIEWGEGEREYGREVREIYSPASREKGVDSYAERDPIIETDSGYYGPTEADARRIVACVNALAGIPTEALEAGALKRAMDSLESICEHWRDVEGWEVELARRDLRALGRP